MDFILPTVSTPQSPTDTPAIVTSSDNNNNIIELDASGSSSNLYISPQHQLINENFANDPNGSAAAAPPTFDSVDASTSSTLKQTQNSWTCHLHASSSSAECSMRLIGETYYHIVPVKTISRDAQRYNTQNISNEFWETFDSVVYVTPIAYASHINDYDFFRRIMIIFHMLDVSRLKYTSQNTVNDFIKRHMVCTATGSRISLCNKHLLKSAGPATMTAASMAAAALKPYSLYTKPTWIRSLLKALFPRIEIVKDGVSPSIPVWAINMYFMPRTNPNQDSGDGSTQTKSRKRKAF